MEMLLGWTLMGAVMEKECEKNMTMLTVLLYVQQRDITDMWTLDIIGIRDDFEHKTMKEHENEVCANFIADVRKNDEGRYEIKLPWKEHHRPLADNKDLAMRRLQNVVNKLKINKLLNDYDAVFEQWLRQGIIELVPEEQLLDWGHYLPHRPVIKENSTTTIHPVFDASAKKPPNPSLNECLETGPNIIEELPAILHRFRERKIGVIADIKQAFLQISIAPKNRDYLRFLWKRKDNNIVVMRHRRVVFGVCCSPFILGAVISLHLENAISCNTSNSRAQVDLLRKLKNNFYVDNCVASVDSRDELHMFQAEATEVMKAASFELRGWESSDDVSDKKDAAVLGLIWNKDTDKLSLNLTTSNYNMEQKITKRFMLSVAHKIFDSLGFACPVMIVPRILLQQAWAKNVSWDEEVDAEIAKNFKRWISSIQKLSELKIERCTTKNVKNVKEISLHTFCDASGLAYAAVTFLRVESSKNINVSFVQAKARVAPLKKPKEGRKSIPRLELLAALIGVRMTCAILNALDIKPKEICYWSDLTTILAWIRRDDNWSTFVSNRVTEIRKYSKYNEWRPIPGTQNPADLPSRGCSSTRLLISKWWEGPAWLRENLNNWPSQEFICDELEINEEKKEL